MREVRLFRVESGKRGLFCKFYHFYHVGDWWEIWDFFDLSPENVDFFVNSTISIMSEIGGRYGTFLI